MINKEIEAYFDGEDKLKQMPSKRKKQIMVYSYLADKIPEDKLFSEKEFNDFLNTIHTFRDPATIRREMYVYGLITRDNDGSNYCLNRDRLSIDELINKYCF